MTRFKEYTHGAACSDVGYALVVYRSLYPSVKLEVIDGRFARGTTTDWITVLEEEAMESTIKLVDDLNLFDDEDNKAE